MSCLALMRVVGFFVLDHNFSSISCQPVSTVCAAFLLKRKEIVRLRLKKELNSTIYLTKSPFNLTRAAARVPEP